jgi:hypothetical protein
VGSWTFGGIGMWCWECYRHFWRKWCHLLGNYYCFFEKIQVTLSGTFAKGNESGSSKKLLSLYECMV